VQKTWSQFPCRASSKSGYLYPCACDVPVLPSSVNCHCQFKVMRALLLFVVVGTTLSYCCCCCLLAAGRCRPSRSSQR
jgi:hypothetical protein